MRILVAGIGNIFMGDDAFGCAVAGNLARRALPEGVRVTDFGIRSSDLAYAMMDSYDAVIMIDAIPHGEPAGTVFLIDGDEEELQDFAPADPDGRSANPRAALRLVHELGGEPRHLYVVGCEPAVVEAEEIGLSDPVSAAVPGAVAVVEGLIEELLENPPARDIIELN